MVSVTNDRFWLSGSHEYVLVEYAEGEYIVKQRILIELFDSPCIENYNNVFVDNDVVYFNLNNGIASYSKNNRQPQSNVGVRPITELCHLLFFR